MGRWVLPNRVTRLGIGLGPFRPFLDTTTLTAQQWLICAALAVSILVVSEVWKAIRRRRSPAAAGHGLVPHPVTSR